MTITFNTRVQHRAKLIVEQCILLNRSEPKLIFEMGIKGLKSKLLHRNVQGLYLSLTDSIPYNFRILEKLLKEIENAMYMKERVTKRGVVRKHFAAVKCLHCYCLI